ncbi:long-chain fatty acid transport protein [Mesorhizobium soli]|uniref:outer membrane protein transport protein n=1 Tax=Pseudaminobacter soli (ex Li et al. 2025) TaxID=1295366 RepID=UPI002474D7FF|nr:outer membrane protein transport protein [Mesorhizobium soli]MDH6229732.1 long-chain fatty acid transport protein [Mesorhizobium soli]
MNAVRLRTAFGAGCLSLAIVGSASAGGFARGSADTDILFEDGNFAMRAGVTYVSPNRKISSSANPALVGTNYTSDYAIPSAAFMIKPIDAFRCAGTLVQAFGGSGDYAAPKPPTGKKSEEFTVDELGLTCAVKFSAGYGNAYILGGAFQETFNYGRVNDFSILGLPAGTTANLQLKGEDTGYRIGAAYEIPEIAFRTQLMYRSGTSYGAEGTLRGPAGIFAPGLPVPPLTQIAIPVLGYGNLPQSVELKLQSGIAPGWLAFGSVKWSDWSVQKSLDVRVKANGALISQDTYNWKDGWTVTGGIGHAFNENVSGALSLTWDQGVATGWDLSSDTYTVAAGGVLKDKFGGELRGGVGVTYLSSAQETKNLFNTSVDSGWAFAVNLGYKVNW